MEPEDAEPFDGNPAPAPQVAAPPRPEIRIVDAAVKRRATACVVCGRPKSPHIEVEIDGRIEFTCRECYELQSEGLSGEVAEYCTRCGTTLLRGDNFCGRCGTPAALRCPRCGARPDEEDAFCGKCGAALRPAP